MSEPRTGRQGGRRRRSSRDRLPERVLGLAGVAALLLVLAVSVSLVSSAIRGAAWVWASAPASPWGWAAWTRSPPARRRRRRGTRRTRARRTPPARAAGPPRRRGRGRARAGDRATSAGAGPLGARSVALTSSGPSRDRAPEVPGADHRPATSSNLVVAGPHRRSCVLASRRRHPGIPGAPSRDDPLARCYRRLRRGPVGGVQSGGQGTIAGLFAPMPC